MRADDNNETQYLVRFQFFKENPSHLSYEELVRFKKQLVVLNNAPGNYQESILERQDFKKSKKNDGTMK